MYDDQSELQPSASEFQGLPGPRVALKILDLVQAVPRDPFEGIGKPEPLKYEAARAWSRRITQEHRLVYLVGKGRIDLLQGALSLLKGPRGGRRSAGVVQPRPGD